MKSAEDIRADLVVQSDRIRARKELTAHAQRVELAKVTHSAKIAMAKLAKAEAAEAKATKATLNRRAFGFQGIAGDPASLAISGRDAQDRVAKIDEPTEALAVLEAAQQAGDEVLARAVAARANAIGGSGWDPVLAEYIATRPDQGHAINSLRELRGRDGMPSAVELFRHVVVAPSELDGLDDHRIEQLAADPGRLVG